MSTFDLDPHGRLPDLVDEIRRGLRFIPGYVWDDDAEDLSKRTHYEPDTIRGRSQPLDDEFWSEFDRDMRRRRRKQTSVAEAGGEKNRPIEQQAAHNATPEPGTDIHIVRVSYDDSKYVPEGDSTFAFVLSAAPDADWLFGFQLCRFERTRSIEETKIEEKLLSIRCPLESIEETFNGLQQDIEIANYIREERRNRDANEEGSFRRALDNLQADLER